MLIYHTARRTIACLMLFLVTMSLSAAPAAGGFFQVSGGIFRKFGSASSTVLGTYDASAIIANGIGREVIHDNTDSAPYFTYKISSAAVADIGGLRSHAFGEIDNDEPGVFGAIPFSVFAVSDASGRYDDVVISGPAGFVTTSINMYLEGSLIVEVPSLTAGSGASAAVSVSTLVNGQSIGTGVLSIYQNALNPPAIGQALGMLTDWRAFGAITSPSFVVPTNVPFTVYVGLQTSIGGVGFGGDAFKTTANSGFLGTLTFATDGPVFSLPDGYTVNSVDAGIIDNTFAVPEPSTLALANIGILAALAYAARRRLNDTRMPVASVVAPPRR
jgi:hypothetical protein